MQSKTIGQKNGTSNQLVFKFQENHPPNKWFTKESVLLHYGENKIEIDSVDLGCVKANRRQ